jgi:hypothetical protein
LQRSAAGKFRNDTQDAHERLQTESPAAMRRRGVPLQDNKMRRSPAREAISFFGKGHAEGKVVITM